ncbi:phosphate acyltransferase PlsX [Exilibacterium tricleocarpae]|uniref:Phosphate acyltransferase n=2 Tax=Exilibacterium tricleocarpae TaxID=2591008 RepID=A0A545T8P5_9GAMM|nr:phosphate acyltransferase PlsX [Exilibacterium tricleocarpae]
MGGDLGPGITVPATLQVAQAHPHLRFVLVGEEHSLTSLLPANPPSGISFEYAADTVGMGDKPAYALRHKRNSSMWRALEMVQSGRAQACVSAGNTGALMAMGKFLLNTFPGIDRPAICKPVPTEKGHSYLLDLGANIDCRAEQLLQFAVMGAVLAAAVDDKPGPSIGLLNIGAEAIKGGESIRLAAALLHRHPGLNYTGYVEGDGIYRGDVDVVVCDGFAGNVALKVSEGVALLLADRVRKIFTANWYSRLVGQLAQPLLRKWHTQFDPARYNGASFLGLQGIVIKSHGGADRRSFQFALETARDQVERSIPTLINDQVAALQAADNGY